MKIGAARQRQPGRLQHGAHGGQQRRLDQPIWPFTDTLGCGTWAGNISCENINWKQFLKYTLMSLPIKDFAPRTTRSSSGRT